MPVEAAQGTQTHSGPQIRKWTENMEKGKLPLFKLRTGDEDQSMQVDNAEDEEKPQEASTNITLAETERALRKGGAQYAKYNAQRVYEERLANQATVENMTARND